MSKPSPECRRCQHYQRPEPVNPFHYLGARCALRRLEFIAETPESCPEFTVKESARD